MLSKKSSKYLAICLVHFLVFTCLYYTISSFNPRALKLITPAEEDAGYKSQEYLQLKYSTPNVLGSQFCILYVYTYSEQFQFIVDIFCVVIE